MAHRVNCDDMTFKEIRSIIENWCDEFEITYTDGDCNDISQGIIYTNAGSSRYQYTCRHDDENAVILEAYAIVSDNVWDMINDH